jgi:hypothetical protein
MEGPPSSSSSPNMEKKEEEEGKGERGDGCYYDGKTEEGWDKAWVDTLFTPESTSKFVRDQMEDMQKQYPEIFKKLLDEFVVTTLPPPPQKQEEEEEEEKKKLVVAAAAALMVEEEGGGVVVNKTCDEYIKLFWEFQDNYPLEFSSLMIQAADRGGGRRRNKSRKTTTTATAP